LEEEIFQAGVSLLSKTSDANGALDQSISPSVNGIIGKRDIGALTIMVNVEHLAL